MIPLKKRIALYKKGIRDYKAADDFLTFAGLCFYFSMNKAVLSELIEIKPPKNAYEFKPYWFPKGYKEPRIQLLKKALVKAQTKLAKQIASPKKAAKKKTVAKKSTRKR